MEKNTEPKSIIIIPAIMPKSFEDLQFKAGSVKDAVNRVQIDIMDGIFVESLSWPFNKPSKGVIMKDEDRAHEPDHLDIHFRQMQSEQKGLPFWDQLDYDVDLMVENPAKAVMEWAKVGINRVILHTREDNTNDIKVAIDVAKEFELEITLAILPGPISDHLKSFIFDKHLNDISGIQCMGIAEVGFQRKPFSPKVFDTIHQIYKELEVANKKMKENHPGDAGSVGVVAAVGAGGAVRAPAVVEKVLEISVDGGVNHENARPLYDRGVDKLISGSVIFDSISPSQEIDFFEDVLG